MLLINYLAVSVSICGLCLLAAMADGKRFISLYKGYCDFLAVPWKIATFFISSSILMGVVPYVHDRSWDYLDSFFMSVLTFVTSPWAIAIIFRSFKYKLPALHLVCAVCCMLFSASWSYDLYNYLKYGYYPPSWSSNLCLSTFLYLAAGLFWNLTYDNRSGVRFSFTLDHWPSSSSKIPLNSLILSAIPFLAVYLYVVFGLFWKQR